MTAPGKRWEKARAILRNELGQTDYEAYFEKAEYVDYERKSRTLYICVPDSARRLEMRFHFSSQMRAATKAAFHGPVRIRILVPEEMKDRLDKGFYDERDLRNMSWADKIRLLFEDDEDECQEDPDEPQGPSADNAGNDAATGRVSVLEDGNCAGKETAATDLAEGRRPGPPNEPSMTKDPRKKSKAYDRLMGMAGLSGAKELLRLIISYYETQKKYRGGFDRLPASHMVFSGDPGTGKSEVAELFARILFDKGIISKSSVVFATRADIVDRYQGGTSPNVVRAFDRAEGGVLFIDEAYSLVDKTRGAYGDEAIAQILLEMERRRGRVIVIFAGYPTEMREFLAVNPGLQSRIKFVVEFQAYSDEELFEIISKMAGDEGLSFSEDVRSRLIPIFREARKQKNFGNGRFARSLYEFALMRQSDRIIHTDENEITPELVSTITADDFVDA